MNNLSKKYKIIMTGGGSGGPVSPLLALVDYLKAEHNENFEFVWVGTKSGPEKDMVNSKQLHFLAISSGKFRRYFSLLNFVDIFKIFFGFLQATIVIFKEKPDLVMSAGGFVSVPVAYAARLMHVPVLIHQQDIIPGLANKIMAPIATKITVTFKKSLDQYGKKAVWTGNPVREEIKNINSKDYAYFGLKENMPVVLILGGGTGAMGINKLIQKFINELGEVYQIFHQTGKGKDLKIKHKNYFSKEFVNAQEMAKLLFLADIVITRCGLGTLTELAYLRKSCVLIPMPNSHQEYNAKIFKENNAAVVLSEKSLDKEKFILEIKSLLDNLDKRKLLSVNIGSVIKQDAEEKIVKEIFKILKNDK